MTPAIEFIVVVLGVTIAINFADVLETKSTNAKMMELLQLGSAEVIASYNVNEDFLSKYQEGEIPIGEVKANAKAKTQSLENILSSEGVMVSICSTTYVGLSNQIELVNAFYSTLEKLDMDSEA